MFQRSRSEQAARHWCVALTTYNLKQPLHSHQCLHRFEVHKRTHELPQSSAETHYHTLKHIYSRLGFRLIPHVPVLQVQTQMSQHTGLRNLCSSALQQESIITNRETWTILDIGRETNPKTSDVSGRVSSLYRKSRIFVEEQ